MPDWELHTRRTIERLGGKRDDPPKLCTIKPASGAPQFDVTGVFSSAGLTALDDERPGVSTSAPIFRAMAADLENAKAGDTLVRGGIHYRIAEKPEPEQPSGHVTLRLDLKE